MEMRMEKMTGVYATEFGHYSIRNWNPLKVFEKGYGKKNIILTDVALGAEAEPCPSQILPDAQQGLFSTQCVTK